MRLHSWFISGRYIPWLKSGIGLVLIVWFGGVLNARFVFLSDVWTSYQPGRVARGLIQPAEHSQLKGTLSPDDNRVTWVMDSDQVDFSARLTRLVQRYSVQITGIQKNAKMILFGVRGSVRSGNHEYMLYHDQLESLDWPTRQVGDLRVWQRPSSMKNGQPWDGTSPPPVPGNRVAGIGLDQFHFADIPSDSDTVTTDFPFAFRGPHSLYVMSTGGDWTLRIKKTDLNWQKGADAANLSLIAVNDIRLAGQKKVILRSVSDDGNDSDDHQAGPTQAVAFTVPELPAGVYKLVLDTSTDVRWSELQVTGPVLSFDSQLYLADGPVYHHATPSSRVELRAAGSGMIISAPHRQSFQTVTVGSSSVVLDKINEAKTVKTSAPRTTVTFPKNDIIIRVDGQIGVTDSALVPGYRLRTVTPKDELAESQLDIIVAEYQPGQPGSTFSVRKDFTLNSLAISEKKIEYYLQRLGGEVQITKTSVRFGREPFSWDRFRTTKFLNRQ